jgi:hypothetical protein
MSSGTRPFRTVRSPDGGRRTRACKRLRMCTTPSDWLLMPYILADAAPSPGNGFTDLARTCPDLHCHRQHGPLRHAFGTRRGRARQHGAHVGDIHAPVDREKTSGAEPLPGCVLHPGRCAGSAAPPISAPARRRAVRGMRSYTPGEKRHDNNWEIGRMYQHSPYESIDSAMNDLAGVSHAG